MAGGIADRFYASFAALDPAGMVAQYASDVVFDDPVFGELRGSDAGDMWRMLCANAKDFTLEYEVVEETDESARLHWVASYTFSSTGRPVTNRIAATMELRDGKIIRHHDSFSLWRWCSQALGPTGRWLGWTPLVQNKVRTNARRGLTAFQANQG